MQTCINFFPSLFIHWFVHWFFHVIDFNSLYAISLRFQKPCAHSFLHIATPEFFFASASHKHSYKPLISYRHCFFSIFPPRLDIQLGSRIFSSLAKTILMKTAGFQDGEGTIQFHIQFHTMWSDLKPMVTWDPPFEKSPMSILVVQDGSEAPTPFSN